MEGVLEVTVLPVVPKPRSIRFVFGVQRLGVAVEVQSAHAQARRLDGNRAIPGCAQFRLLGAGFPAPGVAQYQLRYQMQEGARTAIPHRDFHENVARLDLGVFDEHVEIAILGKDAGVQQFVFRHVGAAPCVLRNQVRVGKCPMRIFIKHLQVGMRGRRIQIKIMLLHVLAVITLGVAEAEQPLLQNRIGAVPQGERQTHQLFRVAEAGDAILAPPIGAAARMIVRKVLPGVAAGAVVLAHGAPLALA